MLGTFSSHMDEVSPPLSACPLPPSPSPLCLLHTRCGLRSLSAPSGPSLFGITSPLFRWSFCRPCFVFFFVSVFVWLLLILLFLRSPLIFNSYYQLYLLLSLLNLDYIMMLKQTQIGTFASPPLPLHFLGSPRPVSSTSPPTCLHARCCLSLHLCSSCPAGSLPSVLGVCPGPHLFCSPSPSSFLLFSSCAFFLSLSSDTNSRSLIRFLVDFVVKLE